MSYVVDLPVFQGPLDLLLHLVRRNEMDIYDIPIAALADQYMATLGQMEALDLEVAGDFLVMACTLLEIKSRMLLPQPIPPAPEGECEDPRAELARRLLEYEAFKTAAESMREIEAWSARFYGRAGVEVFSEYPCDGPAYRNGTVDGLVAALQRMLADAASDLSMPPSLPRDRWTIPLKMRELAVLMHHNPDGVWFRETVPPGADRVEIIVTFLALLEMLKRGRIRMRQRVMWGDIRLLPVVHDHEGLQTSLLEAVA
jgi:segregation and condensation protein A